MIFMIVPGLMFVRMYLWRDENDVFEEIRDESKVLMYGV